MRNTEPVLTRKRLTVTPMTDEALEQLLTQTEDPALRQAYRQMLDGSRADPAKRLWYVPWRIALKSGESIGSVGFHGAPVNAAVELGYGVDEPYRGNDYAFEAAGALIDWAFSQQGVYFVEAEAEADNEASLKTLQRLDFTADGTGAEGPRFLREKPQTLWMCILMCLGMSFGMAVFPGSTGTGMCVGMALGVAVGTAIDAQERKKRAEAGKARKAAREAQTPET